MITALFCPLAIILGIILGGAIICCLFIFAAWALAFARQVIYATIKELALMVVVGFNFFCALFGSEN